MVDHIPQTFCVKYPVQFGDWSEKDVICRVWANIELFHKTALCVFFITSSNDSNKFIYFYAVVASLQFFKFHKDAQVLCKGLTNLFEIIGNQFVEIGFDRQKGSVLLLG